MLGSSVKIASEKKMRAEANSLIGIDNLKCQLVPFTFPVKDGRHTVEIKNVPMCYTPHLNVSPNDPHYSRVMFAMC